ncbi:unnamed protein product, partial [Sphagnum balticum]
WWVKKMSRNPFYFLFSNRSTSSIPNFASQRVIENSNIECFWNQCFDKGRFKNFVLWFFTNFGEHKTVTLLENLKNIGFEYATKAGISLGIDDLKIPPKKTQLIAEAEKQTKATISQYKRGEITGVERFQRLIDCWHRTSESLKQEVIQHFQKTDILNPVYMMAFSGARGNISQVRQLVGMRGLMADPQGQILDFPIRSNFKEGLTLTEYIISCYGARKGIVDTALRTANAGYLTRRLVDVAQHVLVALFDCGTMRGIILTDMKEGNKTIYALPNRLVGRVLAHDVDVIGFRNQEISTDLAILLAKKKKRIIVRSPLTCGCHKLVCQLCYGWSLSQGNLVSIGEAVGIIAGQSIGEPGTQLTMRTFHTGGVFSGDFTDQIKAPFDGFVKYPVSIPGTLIRTSEGKIAYLTRSDGQIFVSPFQKSPEVTTHVNVTKKEEKRLDSQREGSSQKTKSFKIPPFTLLFVRNGEFIFSKQVIAQISNISKSQFKKNESERCINAELEGEILFFKKFYIKEFHFVLKNKEVATLINERLQGPKKIVNWTSGSVLSGKIYQPALPGNFFPKKGDFIGQTNSKNQKGLFMQIKWFTPLRTYGFVSYTKLNFRDISTMSDEKEKFHSTSFQNFPIGKEKIGNVEKILKLNDQFLQQKKFPENKNSSNNSTKLEITSKAVDMNTKKKRQTNLEYVGNVNFLKFKFFQSSQNFLQFPLTLIRLSLKKPNISTRLKRSLTFRSVQQNFMTLMNPEKKNFLIDVRFVNPVFEKPIVVKLLNQNDQGNQTHFLQPKMITVRKVSIFQLVSPFKPQERHMQKFLTKVSYYLTHSVLERNAQILGNEKQQIFWKKVLLIQPLFENFQIDLTRFQHNGRFEIHDTFFSLKSFNLNPLLISFFEKKIGGFEHPFFPFSFLSKRQEFQANDFLPIQENEAVLYSYLQNLEQSQLEQEWLNSNSVQVSSSPNPNLLTMEQKSRKFSSFLNSINLTGQNILTNNFINEKDIKTLVGIQNLLGFHKRRFIETYSFFISDKYSSKFSNPLFLNSALETLGFLEMNGLLQSSLSTAEQSNDFQETVPERTTQFSILLPQTNNQIRFGKVQRFFQTKQICFIKRQQNLYLQEEVLKNQTPKGIKRTNSLSFLYRTSVIKEKPHEIVKFRGFSSGTNLVKKRNQQTFIQQGYQSHNTKLKATFQIHKKSQSQISESRFLAKQKLEFGELVTPTQRKKEFLIFSRQNLSFFMLALSIQSLSVPSFSNSKETFQVDFRNGTFLLPLKLPTRKKKMKKRSDNLGINKNFFLNRYEDHMTRKRVDAEKQNVHISLTLDFTLIRTSFSSPFEGEILKITKDQCLLLTKTDQMSFYHLLNDSFLFNQISPIEQLRKKDEKKTENILFESKKSTPPL